jgi:hypothetical protein
MILRNTYTYLHSLVFLNTCNFFTDTLRTSTLVVLPEGELSYFVSDLCALEDWNDARTHVLGHGDGRYSDGDGKKKQVCLEQRKKW